MTRMTRIVAAKLHEPLRDIRVIFRIRDSDRCDRLARKVAQAIARRVDRLIRQLGPTWKVDPN